MARHWHVLCCVVAVLLAAAIPMPRSPAALAPATRPAATRPARPVLEYNLHYHAAGDKRYLPEGDYQDALKRLRRDFDVRVSGERPTLRHLDGVKLLLIVAPAEKAVGSNPEPPLLDAQDIRALGRFMIEGGGILYLSTPATPEHNLDLEGTNAFLGNYGIQQEAAAIPFKMVRIPFEAPLVRELRWAFYGGCPLVVDESHAARPRVWVRNDLEQKPHRPADQAKDRAGVLLATVEVGRGRLAVVSGASWLSGWALADKGFGGITLSPHDNWELLRRVARWTAGFPDPEAPSEMP